MDQEPKTIADIARIAGVSKATVSRALNDSPLLSAATRERVRAVAREHDFEMNDSARRLSLRQSHVIALVTYPYAPSVDVPDAFLLEIMSGLGAGLHAGGYDLLMIQIAVGDTSWIARYLDSGRVDGFVLLSSSCTDEHLQALETRGAPCVVWGRKSEGRGFSTVTGDSLAGGRHATASAAMPPRSPSTASISTNRWSPTAITRRSPARPGWVNCSSEPAISMQSSSAAT
jgi:DNA-binding LacI/PurR family transcriptional regulator